MVAAPPPDFEALVELCARHVLAPGGGAVDVGAHRGRHLRAMLEAVGPTGQVLGVEPLPDCVAHLRDELGAHPALTLVAGVAGLRREAVELVVAVDRPEESSLRARSVYSGPTALETLVVEAHPLDELTAAMARVDVVKVDVEGAEAQVLEGGLGLLRRHRPVVTFEHGPGIADFGATTADLFALIADAGYDLMAIDGRSVPTAAAMEETVEVGEVWDYVAVPSEHGGAPDLAAALAGALAVDQAIAAAYREVLGRAPDAEGLAWFRPVCRERGADAVVATLRASDEARLRTDPRAAPGERG